MRSPLNEFWKSGRRMSQGFNYFEEIIFWLAVPLLSFALVRVLGQSLPEDIRNAYWTTAVAEVALLTLFLYAVRHFFRVRTLHWRFILGLIAAGGILLFAIY